MTSKMNTTITQSVLNYLNIEYRKSDFSSGRLYFCTLPNQMTFDLFEGTDRTIRLWRFIGVAPICKFGTKWECQKQEYPLASIGLEVTEEGDLILYAEQTVDADDPQREFRIRKMVDGYSKMISTMDFRTIDM